MMKEQTYPRRGLHGAVVHEIGVRILCGQLRPGDPLPTEDALGDDLGVSRTVLREAIKVLAAKGLVEARPKTGTRVRERAGWNLLDPDVLAWRLETATTDAAKAHFFQQIIELRRIIEPEAARLASARATEGEIEELEEVFHALEASTDDPAAYVAPDLRFHALILEAAHNELIEQMGKTLRGVFRALFSRARSPESSERATPLHGRVVEAIRDRDEDRAEQAMRFLIDDTAEQIHGELAAGP